MKNMIGELFRALGDKVFFISLALLYKIFGIGAINTVISFLPRFFTSQRFTQRILRNYGAQVGKNSEIRVLDIDNATANNYANLKIGNNCYIGKNVFFDLVATVSIEDSCSISAGVMFLTHADVGSGPLQEYYPRRLGSIRIGRGSWIGARAIILQGVTIGECSVIGAGAVVTRDIPPYSVAVGMPAKIIKNLNGIQYVKT